MRGIRRFLSIANKTLAVVAGIGLVQMLTIASSFSQSSNPRSLDELYKIRDRLVTELEQPPSPSPEPTLLSRLVPLAANPQEKLLSQLQAVEVQILVEQRANDDLQQAVRLANRAVETKRQQNQSIESSQQTQFLWNQALNNLQSVPQNSFLAFPHCLKNSRIPGKFNGSNLSSAASKIRFFGGGCPGKRFVWGSFDRHLSPF